MINAAGMHAEGRFIGCDATYEDSKIVLFGAPFDGTATYKPGARFASASVRSESQYIETYSPYLDLDMADPRVAVYDAGDLDLPFGAPGRMLDIIDSYVSGLRRDGKFPLMIGGEHLVTLGAVRAFARTDADIAIVQFDAHADLRGDYIGEALSHATVMRRCWDLVGDGRIFQFAVRSGERQEFDFAEAHTHMRRFDFGRLDATLDASLNGLGTTLGQPPLSEAPVYLTIDLDVLDPSELPGTGAPEAGGIRFAELLEAARAVISRCNVVGLDITELCPPADPSGISAALTSKLIRELLLNISNKSTNKK